MSEIEGDALPEGWAWARLGDLVEILDSQRIPVSAKERAQRIGDVPYFGATGQVGWIDEPLFNEELILLGEDGVKFFDHNKRKAYVVVGPSWVNNHAHVLRPLNHVALTEYVSHYLNQFDYEGYANGTTRLKLTKAKMVSIPVPLPPLCEQHRIVEALEERLSRVTNGAASVGTATRRLKRLEDGILDRAARGTLTDSSHQSPTPAESSAAELPPSTRFQISELEPLPIGWSWQRASAVCESIQSGSTPAAPLMHSGSGDIPFLKVYNLSQDGRVDFSVTPTFVGRGTHDSKLKRSQVAPGDVLTNIVGPPLGKTAVVPATHPEWNINQAIVAFRAGPAVLPEWLALTLRSPLVLDRLRSTARATAGQFNIALSTCRELPLPVPPLDEQQRLSSLAAEILAGVRRLGGEAQLITTRGERLKRALMAHAFSSKMVPQDPDDEPASELLARIGVERAAQAKTKPKRKPRREAASAGPPPPAATAAVPRQDAVQQTFEDLTP